jgi:hypothetical protein
MFPRILLCLFLLCPSFFAHADTVWLRSGDRLTGKVKLYDSGKLLLGTDFAGEIAIQSEKIASVESAQKLTVRFKDGELGYFQGVRPGQQDQPGRIELDGDSPRSVALAEVRQMVPHKPIAKDWVWNGNLDGALDRKWAEKSTDKYDLRLKATARNGVWRNTLVGEYHRELKDAKVSTDNYSLEYSLDRFLDRHWFWQGRLEYYRDQIDVLAVQKVMGTGPGYQFWDDELGAFSLTALVSRNDLEYVSPSEKLSLNSAGLNWDYKHYLLAKRFELFSDGRFDKMLDSDNALDINYGFRGRLGLRYKVTSWASLNVRTEWDKMTTNSGEGSFNDRRLVMGVGVNW